MNTRQSKNKEGHFVDGTPKTWMHPSNLFQIK